MSSNKTRPPRSNTANYISRTHLPLKTCTIRGRRGTHAYIVMNSPLGLRLCPSLSLSLSLRVRPSHSSFIVCLHGYIIRRDPSERAADGSEQTVRGRDVDTGRYIIPHPRVRAEITNEKPSDGEWFSFNFARLANVRALSK